LRVVRKDVPKPSADKREARMTEDVQCVIHAMTPTNVLAALCAVETLFSRRLAALELTLIAHYPGGSDALAAEFTAVSRAITKPFSYVRRVISLPQSLYDQLERKPGETWPSALALRKIVGIERPDAWFYAHDVSGDLVLALANAYPASTRVCYGDALGQVFQKEIHLGFLGLAPRTSPTKERPTSGRLNRAVARLLRSLGSGATTAGQSAKPWSIISGSLVPDHAVLILPVDQSGRFLAHTKLTVCPRQVALSTFRKAAEACADLSEYIGSVLAKTSGRLKCLLLTENWAESNTIDFDQEMRLYCSIVEAHCQAGSVVFVKTHPGEEFPRVPLLAERLQGKYEIFGLDKRFQRYPIELWPALITTCRVISTMYPCLSLKFIYDIDVLQVMDDAFIEQWFPPWTWASYKNSLELNMQPLRRLSSWDGRSVLWRGDWDREYQGSH
jgi:hypothetical protein